MKHEMNTIQTKNLSHEISHKICSIFFSDENFPGHRFETQINIQTQIRLNTILTLATKTLNDY